MNTLPTNSSSLSSPVGRIRGGLIASLLLGCSLLSGCAALTNPVANGVPVRILPDELLAESKEGYEPIPFTLLRQSPPEAYILESGDTLGIYIEGILGNENTPPPVNVPDSTELPPSIGYPFPIRDNGTVALPYVGSVAVAEPALSAGITIEEAEERVVDAYREKEILRVDSKRILVSLLRPRYIRVLVLRDDSTKPGISLASTSPLGLGTNSAQIGGGVKTVGQIVELPAYQNDILNALARTGGIPGGDSTQEVIVQRGYWDGASESAGSTACCPTEADLLGQVSGRQITKIPLRLRCGETPQIAPKDVLLHNGDILIVKGQKPEFYYTGGLIPSSEIRLPVDRDITVVEAVLRTRGPFLNGGLNSSNLNGAIVSPGIGNPSPSLLSVMRKTPLGGQVTIKIDLNEAILDPRENILVQADDVLILQENPDEAFTRYFTQVFQMNFFARIINHGDLQGNASAVLP